MNKRKYTVVALLGLAFAAACGTANEQQGATASATRAEDLFAAKCGMCHDFKEDKIGPALAGVQQRWGNDKAKLKSFVRNAQEYIASGDPYAVALYQKWNESAMPSFTGLSEEELDLLIEYLQ
ncbi:MAG: cytochrome c [Chitinophagaceae bacterium]|nr:cytochrome c [Chitinophagaceae bacterium]